MAVLSQALWLAAAVLGAMMAGGSVRERLGLVPGRLRWSGIALALVGFLALSLSGDAMLRILDLRNTGSLRRIDELASQQTSYNALAALVVLGLMPAVAEELLFRGFIQRILVDRLGAWVGIVIAAALFGLGHADPVHGSAAFILGLFLGTLTFIAGGVGPAMVCHGLNNLLGVAVAASGWSSPVPSGLMTIVALAAAAGLALWMTHRLCDPFPQGELQTNSGDAEP
ncbi:MAG: CPBP family intramembrane metalloprotease [bacterium]|nr:CPBP family intramembrane metalloprotease [bacterium]